jgi:hypothetical protein
MKKIALIILAVMAISCSKDKQEIETADIPGQWKTLQTKVSTKTPIHDVSCDGENAKMKADLYTFNDDGSFSRKDICSGKPNEDTQKNRWKYEDHVLTLQYLYKGNEVKVVYSVSDMGNDKVKWNLLYAKYDVDYSMDDIGYYLVMQKQ